MACSNFHEDEVWYDESSYGVHSGAKGTNVLLGFPDEEIVEHLIKDVDFTTSKIGGLPVNSQNIAPECYIIRTNIINGTKTLKLHERS